MSEMRTNTRKGKKLRRILSAALALVLILALGMVSLTASAAIANGQFKLEVKDNATRDASTNELTGEPTITKNTQGVVTRVDGRMTFSKSDTVKLSDLFSLDTMKGAKRITLFISGKSSNIKLTNASRGVRWSSEYASGTTGTDYDSTSYSYQYYYKAGSGVDDTTLAQLLDSFTISTDKNSNGLATVTVTLLAGTSEWTNYWADYHLGYDADRGGTFYSSTVTLCDYATGEMVDDSISVSAENKSSEAVKLTPNTDGTVSATFKMNVTNVGSGSKVRIGYQYRKAGASSWDSTTTKIYGLDDYDHIFVRTNGRKENYHTFKELGTVNSSTNEVTKPKPVTVTVDGLDPDTEYVIRGVVVTDTDTATVDTTDDYVVSYNQPVIASLNIGSISAQEGGTTKTITSAIEFDNRNYDDTNDGPYLSAELWFTDDRKTSSDGLSDESRWNKIVTKQLDIVKNDDGSYSPNAESFSFDHTLPSVDSHAASYKLVVTDPYTGYYVTYYAEDTFVVDSNNPDAPTVTTASGKTFAELQSGGLAVGGANGTVELLITGAKDSGSGLKEYSYEMAYLDSSKLSLYLAENNLGTNASNETVLQRLVQVTDATKGNNVEFTSATSLATTIDSNGVGSASLSIAKDGFYGIRITAVDNVDKKSTVNVMFRVDLTAPSAPEIRMARQNTTNERITQSSFASSKFQQYDDRTYTDSTVWVFIHNPIQAGKTVDVSKYQYSLNGGLSWNYISEATNMDGNAAFSINAGNVTVYKADYSGTESFAYEAAFQFTNKSVQGYQSVMVRATDTIGNTSNPSDTVSMRTNEVITASGSFEHEGIEIALAMGNTGLQNTADIQADLRNLAAQKINEKYYGTCSGKNDTSNPLHYLYTNSDGSIHNCTWGSDSETCSSGSSCPYAMYKTEYNLYTPSMVNMQGMTSTNAATDSSFNWVRFDHTQYITEEYNGVTYTYPTVVFDSANPLHTNASDNADPTQSTYQYKGDIRYTAMTDYVVYTGQTAAITPTAGVDPVTQLTELSSTSSTTLVGTQANQWNTNSGSKLGNDTHGALGRFAVGSGANYVNASTCVRRIYHMVDMTKTNPAVSVTGDTNSNSSNSNRGNYSYITGTLDYAEGEAKLETIYTLGYYYTSSRDWLFLYNGQATRKEILFTIDDSKVFAHSNDGYGFWFNTTIRQNTAGEWVISGYIFLLETKTTSTGTLPYYPYIVRLTDVRLDWFANSRMNNQGVSFSTADDMFSKVNSMMTSGSLTYGSQKLELIARGDNDGAGNTTRNYRLVVEGTTAEVYVWNALNKTADQLAAKITEQEKNGTIETNTNRNNGYAKIHWYQKDGTTAYVNTNPDLTGTDDTMLYIPTPTVDGVTVGDMSKFADNEDPSTEPHTDSNCYGFGPITFARTNGHGCDCDSLVVFSNIRMTMNQARSLSDVITQPKWGTGKVKYILNVSDDSLNDLTDPILSSNIIWRIQTDQAKLINWGSLINKKQTVDFIDNKIEGNGTYVVTRVTTYKDKDVTNTSGQTVKADGQYSQTATVADYIATEYYKSWGIDLSGSTKVPDQFSAMMTKKGTTISLENAQKMTFSVSACATDTANEDYPSGRWYIAYNALGYTGHDSTARFSDNFDLTVSEPGRYTVYFAPDQNKLGTNRNDPTDDTLNPDDALFDFVVSDDAEAQPSAVLNANGTITINDYSIDPDNNLLVTDAANYKQVYANGVQLTGITKTLWRWELSVPYTDPTTKEQSSVVVMEKSETAMTRNANGQMVTSSGTAAASPFNTASVKSFTAEGKLKDNVISGKTAKQIIASDTKLSSCFEGSGNSGYFTSIPQGATLTIYEKVVETSTRLVMKNGALVYEESSTVTSPEKSTNLVAAGTGNVKPVRPASAVTLSKTTLYDTATNDDKILVTRSSFHGQKKQLDLSWEVTDYNGTTSTLVKSGNNYIRSSDNLVVLTATTSADGANYEAEGFNTTTGQASGKWWITKAAVQKLTGSKAGDFTLRIHETVHGSEGTTWSDGTTGAVSDTSGRAIYYKADTTAPTVPTVTLQEGTLTNGNWTYDEYQASAYLDLTKSNKHIKVTVGGSTDNEGTVQGYGVYFYSTKTTGTGTSATTTTTYYKRNSDGSFTSMGTNLQAAKSAMFTLTDTNNSFILDEKSFKLDNKDQSPSVTLNFAVFAYDNRTSGGAQVSGTPGNMTGANETKRTKIEKVKLAKFTPMPLEIKAVNTTGEVVSRIGNDKVTGNTMENPIETANTNVTISFIPKQDWYELSDNNGNAYDKPQMVTNQATLNQLNKNGDSSGRYAKYFTDASTQKDADLTNKVTITYSVDYSTDDGKTWKNWQSATDASYTDTVSVSTTAIYKVTATPKNGSNVVGTTQEITFEVDRDAPTMPTIQILDATGNAYNEGEWTKSATFSIRGSTDNDPNAYYRYSLDNGATWIGDKDSDWTALGMTKDLTAKNNIPITTTGTYYLRVQAVDSGGNTVETAKKTIQVDATPPRVSAPNVKATSKSTTYFTECVVSISQSLNGVVHYVQDYNTATEKVLEDDDIIVTPGDPAYFVIRPESGYEIYSITYGGEAYSKDNLTSRTNSTTGATEWILTIDEVENDATLDVVFVATGSAQSYMSAARVASFNAVQQLRTVNADLYADEVEVYALQHNIYTDDNDLNGTSTTVSPSSKVDDGASATLNITVTNGYRFTKLELKSGGSTTTVNANDPAVTKVDSTHYTYVINNVTGDFNVTVYSEQKVATTVKVRVEGHGSIDVDGTVVTSEKIIDTYVDDELTLTVTPESADYELSSLATGNTVQNVSAAGGVYSYKVEADAEIYAVFELADDDEKATVLVKIAKGSNGLYNGTMLPEGSVSTDSTTDAEVHEIKVLNGGTQVLYFKPAATYKPTDLTYTPAGTGSQTQTHTPVYDAATGFYTVTLTSVTGENNEATLAFVGKQHTITTSAVIANPGEAETTGGGKITVNDSSSTQQNVLEGTDVTVTVTPESGYRIDDVLVNGSSMGKRRSFTLSYVEQDYTITAKFVKRTFGQTVTTHTITATAIGIRDGEEKLNENGAYAFRLNNQPFGVYQNNTSATYTELDANTAYTVTVKARDQQGNESSEDAVTEPTATKDANATVKFTKANVPEAISIAEADDTDNAIDKTVKIEVDGMGNPSWTEYAVYVSDKPTMLNRTLAIVNKNASGDEAKWNTLDDGFITVYNLTAGKKFYFQVVARNNDKEPTEANDENILSLTLSPTAPPENTLYFEEQSAPGAGITLHWDEPTGGEVQSFIIYRDGSKVHEAGSDESAWTDTSNDLHGDATYVYSYAYRNSAGVGARRTAVTEQYYNAVQAVKNAVEGSTEETAAQAALSTLDNLKNSYSDSIFNETMTYPVFPASYELQQAMPTGVEAWQGQIIAYIKPDDGTAARVQKYEVGLNAYKKDPATEQMVPVTTADSYTGKNGTTVYWDPDDYVTTTTADINGAMATWTDLYINWEYKIYVKAVYSTGDGYGTGSSLEADLKKTYKVDPNGYSMTYGNASVAGVLKNASGTWTNDLTVDDYTQVGDQSYTGWSDTDTLELLAQGATADESFIKFNKSPTVYLPTTTGGAIDTTYLYGNMGNDIVNVYDTDYLVVEKGDESTVVKLKVKLYDEDGPANSRDEYLNYTVEGTIGDVTAKATVKAVSADAWEAVDRNTAVDMVLEFDFGKVSSSTIYDTLTLTVKNGPATVDADAVPTGTVNVLINNTTPTIEKNLTELTKKVEAGRNYGTTSTLQLTSSLNVDDLRVQAVMMADQYKAAGLEAAAKAVAKGTANGSQTTQVKQVVPKAVTYFETNQATYNNVTDASVKMSNTSNDGKNTFYWIEANYALNNNLCQIFKTDTSGKEKAYQFMTKNSATGDITVVDNGIYGSDAKLSLRVVAKFGSISGYQVLTLQAMQTPTVRINSVQDLQWQETSQGEYNAYEQRTVDDGETYTLQKVYDEAQKNGVLSADCPKLSDKYAADPTNFDPSLAAYRQTANGGYEVFKVVDTKVTVETTKASGTINVKTGMYGSIAEAKVVMVPENNTDPTGAHDAPPSNGAILNGGTKAVQVLNVYQGNSTELSDNRTATFSASGLDKGTIYYTWVYYKVLDPETNAYVWYHNYDYVALTTTENYGVAYVGFKDVSMVHKETAFATNGTSEFKMQIDRTGEYDQSDVTLTFNIRYFQADQYGNYVTDANGEPIEITATSNPTAYLAAKDTLKLKTNTLKIPKSSDQGAIYYIGTNTTGEQGHMIAKVTMTITKSEGGFNRLTAARDVAEIFVLDDESAVITYTMGVDDQDKLEASTIGSGDDSHSGLNSSVVIGNKGEHYDYTFDGLKDGYSFGNANPLVLSIKNTGEGELTGIKATLYEEDGVTASTSFKMTNMNQDTLAVADTMHADDRCEITVAPYNFEKDSSGQEKKILPDGIYTGWLKIEADYVETTDCIWVHLYQVVGQVNLTGHVYVGSTVPSGATIVGKSLVQIFSGSASIGENRGDPLYETWTDEFGYYEIPNILTNNTYCIVVQRAGCLTYDGLANGWKWTPTSSGNYTWDLRIGAGEVYEETNADGSYNARINNLDLEVLEKYMNQSIGAAEEFGDADLVAILTKCDLNQDGMVNAVDRALLISNYTMTATTGTKALYSATMPKKTA